MAKSDGRGLAIRPVMSIFESIKRKNLDVTVSCKYVQLHHENIFDLLPCEQAGQTGSGNNASSLFKQLMIRETTAMTA